MLTTTIQVSDPGLGLGPEQESLSEAELGLGSAGTGKRRRLQNSCDGCRRRKIRCDSAEMPNGVCSRCLLSKIECSHKSETKKRGPPKGRIHRLHRQTIQSLVSDILSPLTPFTIPSDPAEVKKLLEDLARHIRNLENRVNVLVKAVAAAQDQGQAKSSLSLSTMPENVDENEEEENSPSPAMINGVGNSVGNGNSEESPSIGLNNPPPKLDVNLHHDLYPANSPASSSSRAGSPAHTQTHPSTHDHTDVLSKRMKRLSLSQAKRRHFGKSNPLMLVQTAMDIKKEEDEEDGFGGWGWGKDKVVASGSGAAAGEFGGRRSRRRRAAGAGSAGGQNGLEEEQEGSESDDSDSDDDTEVGRGFESWKRPQFWGVHPWQILPNPPLPPLIFPPPDLLHTLVEIFFTYTNNYFPLLHRPTFTSALSSNLHLENRQFGEVVLAVCAMASKRCMDGRTLWEGSESRQSAGWKWYRQIEVFPRDTTFLEPPSLWQVQKYILCIAFLSATSTPDAGWVLTAVGIRLAQDVGAHRKHRRPPTIERELWKRAFWILVGMDVFNSTSLGRPSVTRSEDYDLDLAIECDDEYWAHPDPELAWKQPKGKPAVCSYWNCMIKLLDVLAFAQRTVYSIRNHLNISQCAENSQKALVEIDSALNKWFGSLPEHLKWNPANRTRSRKQIFFNQSVAIHCTYYWLQIHVHRLFIPQSLGSKGVGATEPIGPGSPTSSSYPSSSLHSRLGSSAGAGACGGVGEDVGEGEGAGSKLNIPSLAICANAARACSKVVGEQMKSGWVLSPNVVNATFSSAIVLLVYISRAKRTKANVDLKKEMRHVEVFMDVFRGFESVTQSAGRYCDILNKIIDLNGLSDLLQGGSMQLRPQGMTPAEEIVWRMSIEGVGRDSSASATKTNTNTAVAAASASSSSLRVFGPQNQPSMGIGMEGYDELDTFPPSRSQAGAGGTRQQIHSTNDANNLLNSESSTRNPGNTPMYTSFTNHLFANEYTFPQPQVNVAPSAPLPPAPPPMQMQMQVQRGFDSSSSPGSRWGANGFFGNVHDVGRAFGAASQASSGIESGQMSFEGSPETISATGTDQVTFDNLLSLEGGMSMDLIFSGTGSSVDGVAGAVGHGSLGSGGIVNPGGGDWDEYMMTVDELLRFNGFPSQG